MAERFEDVAVDTAHAPIDAVTETETAKKVAKAVKPRSTKRATPPKTGKQRATAPMARAVSTRKAGGWAIAAIAGSLGAAATVALLALRGSTPKHSARDALKPTAHRPDVTDSSASFAAGIADENTVPGDGIASIPAPVSATTAHQPDGGDASASFAAGIADEATMPD